MRQAEADGIAREVAVAVLIDLITGPQFNGAVPEPDADSQPRPPRDPGPNDEALARQGNDLLERVVQPRGIT